MSIIEKLRKPRILGIAIFDLVMSFIMMGIIFAILGLPVYIGLLLTIPVGIFAHWIFGIDTTLNYYLSISELPTSDLPTSDLPTSELPTSELPTSELPTSELPTSELPTSE